MDLFKWTKNLKPKFPNLIERFWGKKIDEHVSSTEDIASVPSVNISDRNKAFEVSVALPGLDRNDVKVEIQNDCLIISSEKQYQNEDHGNNWLRREYGYASFQRMFLLPESADPGQVNAYMKNGVLNIKVAKRKDYQTKTKMISIQ